MEHSKNLLKECDAGLSMAVDGIERVLDSATARNFSDMLHKYYGEHKKLKNIVDEKLKEHGMEKEAPNTAGRMGSKMMTSMKLAMDDSDEKIAGIMMDGCNMGIKSVSKYMNEYDKVNPEIMQLANDIVVLEQNFVNDLRQYV